MTGSALLTFIATILAVQPGVVEIDLGSRGGLRAGDEGVIFYEVVLEGEVRAIDLGSASVLDVSKFTAKLGIAPDVAVRPGFLVRFDLPRDRITGSGIPPSEPALVPESANQSVTLNEDKPISVAQTAYIAKTGGRCLKLRSRPSQTSRILTCVAEGTAVGVLDELTDWTEARLKNGSEGWLASRYLSASPPPEAPGSAGGRPGERIEAGGDVVSSEWSPAERVDSRTLLQELEQAEALVDVQLRQLEQSQTAFHEAHEARSELSRRLLEATVAEYESRLAAAGGKLEQTQRERAELAEQYDSLQADFIAKDGDLARVESERRRLIEKLETTNSELVQIEKIATTAKEALRQEIRKTETAVADLRSRLEQRESELAETQAKLAEVEAGRRAATGELGGADSKSKSGLRSALKETTATLLETQREKQALEAWLEERARELAKAEAKVAIMQSEIDRLEIIAPRTRREIESTRALLEQAERRAAHLETRLAAREKRNREVESELEALRRSGAPRRESRSDSSAPIQSLSERPAATNANVVVLGSAQPCLRFRAEPKPDGKAFDCLEPGTRLGALGHWEGWHYVELVDGRAGWVSSRHLGRVGAGGSGP